MTIDLCGKWEFRQAGEKDWCTGTVPGCNYTDLLALGKIPDPFFSTNESEVQWVSKCDWEYRKTVTIAENDLDADEVRLNFSILDTICSIFVNSVFVAKTDNCFAIHSFSIKHLLKVGSNEILLRFHSPVNYVSEIYRKEGAPTNSNGQNGIVHIRKPQCHFGWDWGPVLPLCGICGDSSLEFVSGAKVEELKVTQKHSNGKVTVFVSANVKAFQNYKCEITLTCPNGNVLSAVGDSAVFEIENPQLWWTYELSGKNVQPLYTVSAKAVSDSGSVSVLSKRIGLRVIKLNRERDKYGKNFQFILNGVPLFIKGANYIPPDSFITRFDKKRLQSLLDAARFSNFNMLRVWGGGYYGSNEFFDLCDEMGILVWQDFQFACQAYPFFKRDFLENVKSEIAFNVKRLCHHPSLAVWCGNNEIEDMHTAWVHMTKYVEWTEKFFYHILEDEIRKYDPLTPYTPGSPIGITHNKGVSSDNVGDTHLWGVWHGLRSMDYYRKRMTRFCSEFGFESLPDMKTIKRFAKGDSYSLSDKQFTAHQKCANGNEKIIYYIASRFNLPKNFSDYVYLSQAAQSECVSNATEHWRRHKGRCNGAMYWQFNDCWPVCSWSSIDYYGGYKALQYSAKSFNAPVSICAEDTKEKITVFAINDLGKTVDALAEYIIFDFQNGEIKKERIAVSLSPLENRVIFDFEIRKLSFRYNLKRTGIALRLILNDEVVIQKTVLFGKEKNLDIPKANLSININQNSSELFITVKADKYARLIKLESSKSYQPFEDNYFDLLPGQEKTVTMQRDPALTAEEQIQSISVSSLCDVEVQKNFFKSKIAPLRVFLSPVNIGNAVYHGKIAKDAKLE